jgi:uncharacterized protein
MPAIKFHVDELSRQLGDPTPVSVPLGTPVSDVRSRSLVSSSNSRLRIGVWHCTPGRWRRQVVQAEFCHFLEGDCTFVPDDDGPVLTIRAGDVVYFPANTTGTWEIRASSRKIFIIFDEGATS